MRDRLRQFAGRHPAVEGDVQMVREVRRLAARDADRRGDEAAVTARELGALQETADVLLRISGQSGRHRLNLSNRKGGGTGDDGVAGLVS